MIQILVDQFRDANWLPDTRYQEILSSIGGVIRSGRFFDVAVASENLKDPGEIECFTIGRGRLMIITSRLVHPDRSPPVHRIDFLRLCPTFHHNPTLADSQYTILSSVDVENSAFS
jgi:hypothetical protein